MSKINYYNFDKKKVFDEFLPISKYRYVKKFKTLCGFKIFYYTYIEVNSIFFSVCFVFIVYVIMYVK